MVSCTHRAIVMAILTMGGGGIHTHIERLVRPEASTTRFGFVPHQVECCDQLLGRGRGLATACWRALCYHSAGREYKCLRGWASPSHLGHSIQRRECGPYL